MSQGGEDADDLTVSLSWPGEAAVVPEVEPLTEQAPPTRPTRPRSPPAQSTPRPAGRPAPPSSAAGTTRSEPPRPARPAPEAGPSAARQGPPPEARTRPPRAGGGQAPVPAARRRPPDEPSSNETLINILDHLSTLSRLVTGTSRASSAELEALGSRVEKAVGDLDALQLRVLRSLAGFDALRLRVQNEMAERQLSDDEVDRIADAVTRRLLENVRVETEGDER